MRSTPEELGYLGAVVARAGGYRDLGRLFERHGSWASVWETLASEHVHVHPEEIAKQLERVGARLVLRGSPDYPSALAEIPWPPHGIFVRGILLPPDTPAIAIVGTRKATSAGAATAKSFASALARAGIAVVSGLAFGIDAAAHEGALDEHGMTVAVLATGIDRVYPASHDRLAERILAEGGALISEYPPESPTLPYRFLERNRIVSGLTTGTLVLEAPERSGSLATARFALEQNRAVFVLPGPATHPNFRGSHALIRAGAELVTEPAHIIEGLGLGSEPSGTATIATAENDTERRILEALGASSAPLEVDKIAEITILEAHIVNQTLGFLTIRGLVTETPTGYTAA